MPVSVNTGEDIPARLPGELLHIVIIFLRNIVHLLAFFRLALDELGAESSKYI